jgi:hypothetical protein
MANKHLDVLESFIAFIKATGEGARVPPVSRHDLQRLHETCEYVATRYPGNDAALGVDVMASVCSPGANVPAVWFRHTRFRLLAKQGVLEEWQHGAALADAVYEVAATIPMNGFQIDQEAFIRRLRRKAAA